MRGDAANGGNPYSDIPSRPMNNPLNVPWQGAGHSGTPQQPPSVNVSSLSYGSGNGIAQQPQKATELDFAMQRYAAQKWAEAKDYFTKNPWAPGNPFPTSYAPQPGFTINPPAPTTIPTAPPPTGGSYYYPYGYGGYGGGGYTYKPPAKPKGWQQNLTYWKIL